MRSMIRSASFISSMDSSRIFAANREKPQFSFILAWAKYWLTAVSSALSTSLSISMISVSPCTGEAPCRESFRHSRAARSEDMHGGTVGVMAAAPDRTTRVDRVAQRDRPSGGDEPGPDGHLGEDLL